AILFVPLLELVDQLQRIDERRVPDAAVVAQMRCGRRRVEQSPKLAVGWIRRDDWRGDGSADDDGEQREAECPHVSPPPADRRWPAPRRTSACRSQERSIPPRRTRRRGTHRAPEGRRASAARDRATP